MAEDAGRGQPFCLSALRLLAISSTLQLVLLSVKGASYVIDDRNIGRTFDGIGGLSGGGATSKLLVSYSEPYRSQILDYLFKPGFGASLQILKVEIGGDAQSTDGTESSHQHEEWDENYKRGYEWWLMLEAKKRNPNIKLYGLSWAFPGWVSNGTGNPYKYPQLTATYTARWINAAKKVYNLDIDYIGVWNERDYDINYILVLRKTLDDAGYSSVEIVAADGNWAIAHDVLRNSSLRRAMSIIGAHYPGTLSSEQAVATGLKLWSSEDYSTFNDKVGAGCWARILNQNYVNGNMTSTISWNLIAGYYKNLPYGRDGLMTSMEPWSGHYVVESPIWVTAHTTQFTNIGWRYLQQGIGSGKLDKGGSYVSLVSPDRSAFTMVIETMSHNHSQCVRPVLPPYTVVKQRATFQLKGILAKITHLNVWYSKLDFSGENSTLFKKEKPIKVLNGSIDLMLDVDSIITVTTVTSGLKGDAGTPPVSKPFPSSFSDNYESYPEFSEAKYFVPQAGVWEVRRTSDPSHGQVNRQVVLHRPVAWCQQASPPLNLAGNYNWMDVMLSSDFYISSVNGTTGVFLAARVDRGGCDEISANGIFYSISIATQTYTLTLDVVGKKVVVQAQLTTPLKKDTWYNMALNVAGDSVSGTLNYKPLFFVTVHSLAPNGFVAMGTATWGYADFDNLMVQSMP